MKTMFTLWMTLIMNYWSLGQYPFVQLPYSILDELGTMEVPILPDLEVPSNQLPRIELIWNNRFWNVKDIYIGYVGWLLKQYNTINSRP